MDLNFLFWFFFIGILVAVFQDLKRREVDNWLSLFLLLGSLSFFFYKVLFSGDFGLVFLAGFIFVIMFIIMNLFYYGRIFGGGDACLLFAMSVFFISNTFLESILNIGLFLFLLLISGSIYGILYSSFLYFRNFNKVNKLFTKKFRQIKPLLSLSILLGIFSLFLIYYSFIFIIIPIVLITLPFLYIFAKGLEDVSMVKIVPGNELREGDWLVHKIHINGKWILPDWEGLLLEEIKLLKNKKKIKIKQGLPFVPVFLIAFLLYSFFRNWFLSFL